jgi:hypothetical protein
VKLDSLETSQEERVEGKVDDIKRKILKGDHPDPIIVDTNDHIVDGHHRYEAYRDLGYTEIAIQRVDAELPELIDRYQHTTDDTETVKESFNQPYPVKVRQSPEGEDYEAHVQLPDGTGMEILFTNHGGIWDMEFHRGGSQDVTGEGDAFRIFATMLEAVKQFIQVEKPGIVSFRATKDVDPSEANPESRAKLYNRMVDKFAGKMGYTASMDDYGDTVEYELVAKRGMREGNKAQLRAWPNGLYQGNQIKE